MEPNLNIYNIALRYIIMALLVGIGAGLTSLDGFVGTLGYVSMAFGVVYFLYCILAYDPTKGENKEALEQAAKDFMED